MRADIKAAIVAERAAVAAHAEHVCGEIEALIAKGRVTAEEGSMLQHRLRAFAGGIAAGLHVGGGAGWLTPI